MSIHKLLGHMAKEKDIAILASMTVDAEILLEDLSLNEQEEYLCAIQEYRKQLAELPAERLLRWTRRIF